MYGMFFFQMTVAPHPRTLSGSALGGDAVLEHLVQGLPGVLRQHVALLAGHAQSRGRRQLRHLLGGQHLRNITGTLNVRLFVEIDYVN